MSRAPLKFFAFVHERSDLPRQCRFHFHLPAESIHSGLGQLILSSVVTRTSSPLNCCCCCFDVYWKRLARKVIWIKIEGFRYQTESCKEKCKIKPYSRVQWVAGFPWQSGKYGHLEMHLLSCILSGLGLSESQSVYSAIGLSSYSSRDAGA